jgi:hypothetical protein
MTTDPLLAPHAGFHRLYLHYQYVPEPRTALSGVRKLPPGHLPVIETNPWKVESVCYWRLERIARS